MGTEENTPIAWVVNGHLLEQGPSGGYIEVKPGGSYSRWEEMPTDAVPLVPVTELDEATDRLRQMIGAADERANEFESRYETAHAARMMMNAEVERLKAERDDPYSEVNQQADAWRAVAEHPVIGPMHALPDRGTYAKSVLARLDQLHEMQTALAEPIFTPVESPQLPALDTIEALRFAADVCDQHNRSLGRDWHQHQFPPRELRERIRDLEREAEADARDAAEREARIEEFAEQLYIKHELRVRGDGKWRPWSDILDHTRDLWREEAAALDDLGYRKTGGE